MKTPSHDPLQTHDTFALPRARSLLTPAAVKAIAIGIALVAGACARRGELLQYHRVEPATESHPSSGRSVRVERVSSLSVPGGRYRPTTLWIELALDNRDADAWDVDCATLALEHGNCAGFADQPMVFTPTQQRIAVAAGASQRIWARFDRVPTQDAGAAAIGVDSPRPITLSVGDERLALADPARGAPLWTASSWPYFGTFGLGFAFGFGTTDGAGMDVAMSMNRRFGELDLGLLGSARVGVDVQNRVANGFAALGGGLTTGYTVPLGRRLYVRGAVNATMAWSGHGMIETTPVWLGGELQFGFTRSSLYPFRERTTSYTVGWYLRGEGRVASISEIEEPFAFGLGLGLVMRGGS